MSLSICVSHTPWRPERVASLECMIGELARKELPMLLNDTDYRGRPWQEAKVDWAMAGWTWSALTDATHHLFLTDDLYLSPDFLLDLTAMLEAVPDKPIGLMSNAPCAVDLFYAGARWYRTNSWIVGPAYVLPHAHLVRFLDWFRALPDGPHTTPGTKAWANDDSSLNEWITNHGGGGETWHPLPTIIEHRADLESTVGHGDAFSRERVSWRATRTVRHTGAEHFEWVSTPHRMNAEELRRPDFWQVKGAPPMVPVG